MRKFTIPAAILVSTLATAAPAAAQWAQPGYGYGYNQGQGRQLEMRVVQLRRQIAQLDRSNMLSNREAFRLDAQARNLQYRIRQSSYNGLDGSEHYGLERQIAQLEQNIRYQAADGNRRYGYNNGNYNGYGNGYNRYDRDRDGRDDRYEDDRGRQYDARGNHERREDHEGDDD